MYVLDGAGSEGRDPLADLQSLLYEVAQFDEAMARSESESGSNTSSDSLRRLLKKPAIVFSNKADIEECKLEVHALTLIATFAHML